MPNDLLRTMAKGCLRLVTKIDLGWRREWYRQPPDLLGTQGVGTTTLRGLALAQ